MATAEALNAASVARCLTNRRTAVQNIRQAVQPGLHAQKLADLEDRIFRRSVPFEAGNLEARGTVDGQVKTILRFVTAKKPSLIQRNVDKASPWDSKADIRHSSLKSLENQPRIHVDKHR